MIYSQRLFDAAEAIREGVVSTRPVLERRRLSALVEAVEAEARIQRQLEETRRVVVEFIPTEPLRRIG